jgi:hypothetical protein
VNWFDAGVEAFKDIKREIRVSSNETGLREKEIPAFCFEWCESSSSSA